MTRPLRIALVSAFPPGQQSLNEYGLHLALGLAARADVAEVIVIADKLETPMPENDYGPKIRVERVWSFNTMSTLPKLVAAIKSAKVDGAVWNLQMATFGDREVTAALGLLGPWMTRMTGTTSGVIAHNLVDGVDLDQTILKGQKLRQAIVRAGANFVTRALASASYLTVTLRGYHEALEVKFPNSDISLVPHGTFDTVVRDLTPFSKRAKRIVTMGKFGTYKRLDTLLEAFDILRKSPENDDLELVIGGSNHPNTPGYLEALAHERANDNGVVFHGYVAEDGIPDFFSSAQLCVFDYTATTGSSGVLHQTSSYGAVPVFPRIGDFIDVCQDEGISGINYEAQNSDDMALQMQKALLDGERSQNIANQNMMASFGYPFDKVIDFHVKKIARKLRAKPQKQNQKIAQTTT